jgi:hypothetical protein
MRGIRIEDGTSKDPSADLPAGQVGGLNFDLAEILVAIGDGARSSEWLIGDLDCFGESHAEFVAAYEAALPISGERLLDLAQRISQIIDGEFAAQAGPAAEPWLVIKAIDSSWWEVWTDDEHTRASLRRRFRATSDIDEQAA